MSLARKNIVSLIAKLLIVAGIVAVAFWLGREVSESQALRETIFKYGYFGVFIAAAISGINVIVPIPIISFLPAFVESGLNFWLVIGFIAAGVTLGDSVGYLLGRAGRELAQNVQQEKIQKLEALRDKHKLAPFIILFLFASFVPFPNEVIVIPLAVMGYKFLHMLPWILAGNLVFNIASAYGFVSIFQLFG